MTKRHCYVQDVGIAIEKLTNALDPQREKPFRGDILDLLEWAARDVLTLSAENEKAWAEVAHVKEVEFPRKVRVVADNWRKKLETKDAEVTELRQQLAERDADASTAWAQAHRLALELECLIIDTKDNAVVSKWWDSAFEAMEEYHKLKPGAAEDAEAWSKMRKAGI